MDLKNIFSQLNVLSGCKKYGLSPWQCPQFLFLIMGIIIISSSLAAWSLGNRYIEDPTAVALIVLAITAILFIIAFIITNSFERLAEVSRLKSEFINIISHQLKSPLTNIIWALEILTSEKFGKVEEQQERYFKIIEENGERMKKLVSDLLTVSRIESGSLPFNKQKVSLEGLIQELISEFTPFLRASNIELRFNKEPNIPELFTDYSQVKQIIKILLDNAVHYIKTKGEIEINLKKRGRFIYFEIRDNGIGIPKEEQKYIFQKFFRAESGSKYQVQGSGLGLYIAKAIVEKLDGKIGFKSQKDIGSTFWFTIPIKS